MYWNKLKMQSAIPAVGGKSDKDKKKKGYTSAVGRYSFLNKVWKPVHRICFLDPHIIKNEKELFKVRAKSYKIISLSYWAAWQVIGRDCSQKFSTTM